MSMLLAANKELAYRVAYLREADFEEKMRSVYIGKQTATEAPFLGEILVEMIDIQALVFLEVIRENPQDFDISSEALSDLEFRIYVQEDSDAAMSILSMADPRFLDSFQRDVYRFLMDNHMSFYIEDLYTVRKSRKDSILKNPPVLNVW